MARSAAAAALLAALVATGGTDHAAQVKQGLLRDQLQRRLDAIAASVDGIMGYAVLDLQSGERLGRLENEVFPTASTIKLGILYELFRQADDGRLQLDRPEPLDRRTMVGGAGILRELTTPSLSLRDHATLMIVLSDNTATNVLIERLGLQTITRRLEELGLTRTKLRRRMIDTEAALRGEENVSSPADLVRLLELLKEGEGLRPESHAALLEVLTKTKSSPMLDGLPSGIRVASKPGTLEGVRVDAGIVFVERRPYAFAAMCTFLQEDREGEQAIAAASRAAFEYFSRLARGSEYGRQIGRP
jgi:beta-lactamase class A